MPAMAPAITCHGAPRVWNTAADDRPLAAMAKPVRRHPIQNLAVMPMNKAASAKSAPIRRGSPR